MELIYNKNDKHLIKRYLKCIMIHYCNALERSNLNDIKHNILCIQSTSIIFRIRFEILVSFSYMKSFSHAFYLLSFF